MSSFVIMNIEVDFWLFIVKLLRIVLIYVPVWGRYSILDGEVKVFILGIL
jgi:hypothetical protein